MSNDLERSEAEGPLTPFEDESRSSPDTQDHRSVLESPPPAVPDVAVPSAPIPGVELANELKNREAVAVPSREPLPGAAAAAEAEEAFRQELEGIHMRRVNPTQAPQSIETPTPAPQPVREEPARISSEEPAPPKKPTIEAVLDTGEDPNAIVASSGATLEGPETIDPELAKLEKVLKELEEPFVTEEQNDLEVPATISVIPEEEEIEEDTRHTDVRVDSIKSIRMASNNRDLKTLQKLDVTVEKISSSLFDMSRSAEFEREFIIKARSNILNTPRAVRILNLLSGSVCEIAAWSTVDILNVNRAANQNDYIRRKEAIFKSLFDHIIYHTAGTSTYNLTFEEWLNVTKLPDLDTYFFGALDATFPGKFEPSITCSKCNTPNNYSFMNEDISFTADGRLSEMDVKTFLRERNVDKMKTHPIYQEGNVLIRRKLPSTQIYVEQSIPSLREYLDTLTAIDAAGITDDISSIDDPESPDFPFLIAYLYVKRVAIPNPTETQDPNDPSRKISRVRFYVTDDKSFIATTISKLSRDDFKALFDGKEIHKLMRTKPIRYSIRNVTCKNDKCKAKLSEIRLDMEDFFFLRIGEDAKEIRGR